MKVLYEDILRFLEEKPSKEDLSLKLFQLGHEHDISGSIFDIEFTPNRGDCLSLLGIARDLNVFYKSSLELDLYEGNIDNLDLEFSNKSPNSCPKISFLEMEISHLPVKYCDYLENFFKNLEIGKNNFFTDVSNYLSYELGQPTHCFDKDKIEGKIVFENKECSEKFETLLGSQIELKGKNSVFMNNDKIISLAGVMGGESTACSKETRKVLVECAYFDPEAIIGKSLDYSLSSEAAHKFERGVDVCLQVEALKRFAKIVSDHTSIDSIKTITFEDSPFKKKKLDIDVLRINKILGTSISAEKFNEILNKLGFEIESQIIVPSYRSDIYSQNDLAEEIARTIGYDEIENKSLEIKKSLNESPRKSISTLKRLLSMEGFTEVINFPFTSIETKDVIAIDNPLDSNKKFLRTSLKESLINNLLYNERRQKDSIKIFEVSDLYFNNEDEVNTPSLGIIASGRIGHNHESFSKNIDKRYLEKKIRTIFPDSNIVFETIPRQDLDSKIKNDIYYLELNLDVPLLEKLDHPELTTEEIIFKKYKPISDYPSSSRDFSFLISKHSNYDLFINQISNIKDENLKNSFIFDFYKNEVTQEIKVGVRMIFQSKLKTLSEEDLSNSVSSILRPILKIEGVSIPGM